MTRERTTRSARPARTAAVRYDPQACRAWLNDGAAEEHAIDDDFTTIELSIPAGLERLLAALHADPSQQAWRYTGPLRQVLVWRTADGNGVNGGAIITADLDLAGRRLRLATNHQGFDDFTDLAETSGIDAAVQALGRVAEQINHALAGLSAHHLCGAQGRVGACRSRRRDLDAADEKATLEQEGNPMLMVTWTR